MMPLREKYNIVYSFIEKACIDVQITPIRADKIQMPGIIIDQIWKNIKNSFCVIAEISECNCNVYYELGLSHAIEKPTILLIREDKIDSLPFDLKHIRCILYRNEELKNLYSEMCLQLQFLKGYADSSVRLNTENFLSNLSKKKVHQEDYIQKIKTQMEKEYSIPDLNLHECKIDRDKGVQIIFLDFFGTEIRVIIDINGLIHSKRIDN